MFSPSVWRLSCRAREIARAQDSAQRGCVVNTTTGPSEENLRANSAVISPFDVPGNDTHFSRRCLRVKSRYFLFSIKRGTKGDCNLSEVSSPVEYGYLIAVGIIDANQVPGWTPV